MKGSPSNILKHFQVFRINRLFSYHTSGSVAIIVQRSNSCVEVSLNTASEAVAVGVLSDRLITVCSLYVSQSYLLTLENLESLHHQVSQLAPILSDFNSQDPMWRSGNATYVVQ